MATVKHVVVDSGAFIRNAPIREIGENIYTLHDVVNEIKDKATRDRLQVLPYTIKYKEPSSEAILFVTEFSKKTGDYRSLSVVDIRIIALTYQLEKENVGTDHINKAPPAKAEWNTTRYNLEKATDIAGFYLQSDKESSKSRSRNTSECNKTDNVEKEKDCGALSSISETSDSTNNTTDSSNTQYVREGQVLKPEHIGEEQDSDDEEEIDEDDDDEGWITPSNIDAIRKQMEDVNTEKADVTVGCITTDFAMQNVLIQMGLNVVSVDGMLIKKAKNYVLRCFACMKITKNLNKQFCPLCGNKTLKRLSMTVEEDGSVKYYFSTKKLNCTKGMNKNLGMPRSGRHANNPYLVEDQPMPQQHPSRRSQVKLDPLSYDYIAGTSPFAINDVTSRAAQLGINNKRMREFHQNGKRTFIRKK
ncbi:hypothetical protein LOTGIDRAFT_211535 [Lottia gigantea]|uniref:RNA-binding protein NOB1 n=1 Tax=Lottia gigantea TaxID=225164 RepID=V4B3G2_LOTGI|nr:hypothetical protein LOTGIDRAFT_211535 [Lottia gigantea]ESO82889.1 hypothetical protein LOTGIDRAFT_211535 [Lottia gigantea]